MDCSLYDIKGRDQLAALIVERMPSGLDTSNHPVFVVIGKLAQYFPQFKELFLLRLQCDLYLHSHHLFTPYFLRAKRVQADDNRMRASKNAMIVNIREHIKVILPSGLSRHAGGRGSTAGAKRTSNVTTPTHAP